MRSRDPRYDRRTLLGRIVVAVSVLGLAGCATPGEDSDEEGDEENGDGEDSGDEEDREDEDDEQENDERLSRPVAS